MTRGDATVERASAKLQELADRWAGERNGWKAKVAEELAEDAVFLRKLKPSLIAARARGELPTDQAPEKPVAAPSAPQLPPRPSPKQAKRRGGKAGGPNPFVVIGISFAAGIALAKFLDWRSHAHPRG